MFTLLIDNGAEERDEGTLVTGVGGELHLGLGESAKDDVGKEIGESNGFEESSDGEIVLAGRDSSLACILQGGVYSYSVDFLLLDTCEW